MQGDLRTFHYVSDLDCNVISGMNMVSETLVLDRAHGHTIVKKKSFDEKAFDIYEFSYWARFKWSSISVFLNISMGFIMMSSIS